MESRYRPGTIVSARGREWIVLPPREPEVLRLRPLTTAQGDEVGLFLPLEGERVRPARFADPEPVAGGDATGIMTLFDAARLSLRSGAGPFRSLGRISVVPRPYQFVPLIMALRQSPVRLLIADDVGVGKTIEAAMIARELLDRGLARRLAVLCRPISATNGSGRSARNSRSRRCSSSPRKSDGWSGTCRGPTSRSTSIIRILSPASIS
jgi:hypothetical protein